MKTDSRFLISSLERTTVSPISPRRALRFCSFNVSIFAESLSIRIIFLFLVSSSFAIASPIPPLPRTA
jgi:hypothetical protein